MGDAAHSGAVSLSLSLAPFPRRPQAPRRRSHGQSRDLVGPPAQVTGRGSGEAPSAQPGALPPCTLWPLQPRSRPQAHGQTFTFPDLFPEKKPSPEDGSAEDSLEALMEEQRQRQHQDPRRGGVPQWFGL